MRKNVSKTTWLVRWLIQAGDTQFLHFTFYACSHSVLCELPGFLSVSSVTRQPITTFPSTFFAILLFSYFLFLLIPRHTSSMHACVLCFYPDLVTHTSVTSMPTATLFFSFRSWFSALFLSLFASLSFS